MSVAVKENSLPAVGRSPTSPPSLMLDRRSSHVAGIYKYPPSTSNGARGDVDAADSQCACLSHAGNDVRRSM